MTLSAAGFPYTATPQPSRRWLYHPDDVERWITSLAVTVARKPTIGTSRSMARRSPR